MIQKQSKFSLGLNVCLLTLFVWLCGVTATTLAQNRSIDIETATNGADADNVRGSDVPNATIGDVITWTYVVTNTGDVTLTNVNVSSNIPISDIPLSPVTCPATTLVPAASMTCTMTGTVTSPNLILDDPIPWTYDVTNTGNVTLTDVILEPVSGTARCPKDTLAPGESMICTVDPDMVTQAIYKIGRVTGNPSDGSVQVEDVDLSHVMVIVPVPSINVNKRAINDTDTQVVTVGDDARFKIVVENNGTEDLTNIIISDPLIDSCIPALTTITTLGQGDIESFVCTTHAVSSGSFTHIVTTTGTGATSGIDVSDTDDSHYESIIPVGADRHEGNDSCGRSTPILTDGTAQAHTFHDFGDVDWVQFDGEVGEVYTVIGNVPLTSTADLVLEIRNSCNDTIEEQGYTFAPGVRMQFIAPATETYYVRVNNNEPSEFGDDVAYSLSVRKHVEDAPKSAVIIVAGRQQTGDILQDNIHHVTNNVYKMYRQANHDDLRIRYLANDLTLDPAGDGSYPVHDMATADNLRDAITSWATTRVDSKRALTIYMMSHGDQDRFFLDGEDEVVTPADLDSWLEELEQTVRNRGDGELMVNVIIDACHSGSFIDTEDIHGNVSASVSDGHPNRIVMSSAARYELAWASRQGALFSDYFTFGIERDFTAYDAFNNASGVTRRASWPQTPWLDDNGNGIPNDPDDGLVAAERGLGIGSSFNLQLWEPYIVDSDPVIQNTIRVRVRDEKSDIERVWAVLYPPSYMPPNQDGVRLAVADEQPIVMLFDEGGGVYEDSVCPFLNGETGPWSAIVYAEDGDGLVSRPETITFDITNDDIELCPLVTITPMPQLTETPSVPLSTETTMIRSTGVVWTVYVMLGAAVLLTAGTVYMPHRIEYRTQTEC